MYEKIIKNVGGIEGLCILEPKIYKDDRGYFLESYNDKELEINQLSLDDYFVQDNESYSKTGTLRGLHYQSYHPQTKIVRVVKGNVFDVAIDLRPYSPTYGHAYGVMLSNTNHRQFYIPRGFAHGFYALEDTLFLYKCDDFYYPDEQCGINPFDKDIIFHHEFGAPSLGIPWPLANGEYIITERDRNWPMMRDLKK